ncbi:MAG: 4Fe-4S dicluster domain-containing protein [Ignavibacteria bacterium]|jgi:NADH-quinone oxidoreductase subunit I|nr:4Fe-4S dicluster domain-containing protein [Ignavibacteria bacterium]
MLKYLKDIFQGIVTPFQGMKITTHYIFTPRVTKKYPEAYTPSLPISERNRLDVDMVKCTGCQLCSKSCPSHSIAIETVKAVPTDANVPVDENGKAKKLLVTKFDIDFGTCCFCTLCEENCNFGAIHRTATFDYSTYRRGELQYHFSNFTQAQVAEKKDLLAKFNAEAKKKAAEASENKE